MENQIKYWAFEGNEGTGKTVLSKAFAKECGAAWTYEPNAETEELKTLRKLALTDNSNITKYAREMMMFANRSIHHNTHVSPILGNQHSLVTDRSFLSGMVYANIQTYTFKEWMALSLQAGILTLPNIIIYCISNNKKMNKNKIGRENDIYDNANNSIISKIDLIYEDALTYLKECQFTKHIPIIRFENNFNIPVESNIEKLLDILKVELK